jgi:protein-tyrosine phosphatase
VLVVCTANICRSPVAERALLRHLTSRGVPATVTSAGTHGGRLTIHHDTVRAAAEEADLDVRDHTSRLLSTPLIDADGADLVVTMSREHLRRVAELAPHAWPRSFTLKELARRAFDVPTHVDDLSDWIGHAGAGRRAADLMAPSDDDDLADPYGLPYAAHATMVREVDELARRLADQLAGLQRPTG